MQKTKEMHDFDRWFYHSILVDNNFCEEVFDLKLSWSMDTNSITPEISRYLSTQECMNPNSDEQCPPGKTRCKKLFCYKRCLLKTFMNLSAG